MISQKNSKSWRNPWFFFAIAVVVIGVSVNAVLIWWSLQENRSTFVDNDGYNTKNRKSDTDKINEIEAHNALAWQTTIKPPATLLQNSPAAYEVEVRDKQGAMVSGEMVVQAYRAADASKDFDTPFREVAPGKYQGYVTFPLKGYWELRIHVKRGKEVFETNTGKIVVAEAK